MISRLILKDFQINYVSVLVLVSDVNPGWVNNLDEQAFFCILSVCTKVHFVLFMSTIIYRAYMVGNITNEIYNYYIVVSVYLD